MVKPRGNALVGDGESLRLMALAASGSAGCRAIISSRTSMPAPLVPVLEDFNPGDEEPMQAIYVGPSKHLPARVRAFLDFLAANVRPHE